MVVDNFAQYVTNLTYEQLPPEVIQTAKERILDTLGAAIAGGFHWDYRLPFLRACQNFGAGDEEILLGSDFKFPLARAAMIHATFAHAIELDDGHTNAGVHAGAAVVMTALTLGAKQRAKLSEVIVAIVAGYEIVYRLASAMAPHQIKKGFHPSGNDDTVGAAVVAGKLLGLSCNQLANALGLSALYAAGLMEATVSGQQSKCILIGNAVYNGISAAYYAAEGLDGTRSAFEGSTGFLQAKSRDVSADMLCENLGNTYMIQDTYSKLYPTCRHAQPAIETALELAEEYSLSLLDIDSVHVGTFQVAYDLTGKIIHPCNTGEAKFSIPYGVAVAIQERNFGTIHLTEPYYSKAELRDFAESVTVSLDAGIQAIYPKIRGATVQFNLKDGRVLSRACFDLKGSPAKPIGRPEIEKKFRLNVADIFSESVTAQLIEQIFAPADNISVDTLMDLATSTS